MVALDQLIDTALLFTGPDRSLSTKVDDLTLNRAGAIKLLAHEPSDVHVRVITNDVVVHQVDFVIEQVVERVLERAGQQRAREVDTLELQIDTAQTRRAASGPVSRMAYLGFILHFRQASRGRLRCTQKLTIC